MATDSYSNPVEVKNQGVFLDLLAVPMHPLLFKLVKTMFLLFPGEKFVITSAFRPGPGVHGTDPYRGLDIRSHNLNAAPEYICHVLNKEFVYDPEREHMKVAIFHDAGQGEHIHLQVHPRTWKRV